MTTHRQTLASAVIHFAGDSGDGMQVTGMQFTDASAAFGNDIRTLPDFPAEIRAPAGTLAGVSGFQLSFSDHDIHTPGDTLDVLVAMNPAALKANIKRVQPGGIVIVDEDKFQSKELRKIGETDNPLTSGELAGYRVIKLPITTLTLEATQAEEISHAKARKCKNMFTLGVLFWLYERPFQATYDWLAVRYQKDPAVAKANQAAFKAGHDFAITTEIFNETYRVKPATFTPGRYKQITGNMGLSLGAMTASHLANKPLYVAGYPITPASDILHHLAGFNAPGVTVFQAEDEMGAIGAAIGAAYGGHLALTCTSGPGMDLKAEAIGLAVMAELPLVIVDVQRAGPSTGMPTKVEQSDLLMAIHGRHGECPVPVLAPSCPGDCFEVMITAFRMAVQYMTPVIVLSDAYLANSAAPWQIPDAATMPPIPISEPAAIAQKGPYQREPATLARPWITPGMPEKMHCLGGLEKAPQTGSISYDPAHHAEMVALRQQKVERATEAAAIEYIGPASADILLISWGSTRGAVKTLVDSLSAQGVSIAMAHLRHLYPFPAQLADILKAHQHIYVVELNAGHLLSLIRSTYLVDAKGIQKITGQPFQVSELEAQLLSKLQDHMPKQYQTIETLILQNTSQSPIIEREA